MSSQQRGRGAPPPLPEGSGRELVQAKCVTCHQTNLITNSGGYNREGWDALLKSMLNLSADEAPAVLGYLATNFPEKPRPAAVVIPGTATVSIKEWMVPSLGSRPHDPLATPDGAIWWTGMFANVLGRLDPKTGAMKEFPLNTVQSGPHGLTNDRAGNIWFTANSKAYVGKLDPRTGEVTEFAMPDPAARDPHTPIFDKTGTILWFTVQGGNMVGRLNPQTGEIKLVTMPTQGARPYGILMNSRNVPFFVDFGVNKVASIDPNTMAVREYPLPNAESRPRRIAITSDDMIWYSDYSRGYLGRLNPTTGEVKEWPSPGGPQSQPYGITVSKDIVWYSESAVRPNTLVRFDPKTEKFQTWIIPSGGGIVRHMMTTSDGNLVLACSGVNRVALVEIR
ncbi:MAG: hypothetical protein A3G76_14025 [Acidobacteria bacterium RIFCSPLOWO2_12_FULL_65_11]|nr:MAG: hypothetical protein A3H95_00170 [Acidobacteria bacterium RIFCSPLOWO2_02_FULL_64_15]OFW28780.1 MAG: hypothetical protein A3G76_14025 [Acidobacteria bacterium RIFCSPLOWO2_12_FULL_65_11]